MTTSPQHSAQQWAPKPDTNPAILSALLSGSRGTQMSVRGYRVHIEKMKREVCRRNL